MSEPTLLATVLFVAAVAAGGGYYDATKNSTHRAIVWAGITFLSAPIGIIRYRRNDIHSTDAGGY
ncbi:hypothetical protein [Haloarchaeobius litoreus]|uniref:Phospholipase_D-nuclease N-terminal n=1 Tax=Haloarchaeobius litoreus TaxID=755306 RepID=A0ABD6DET7_9EURY|nr:hypothetical protein [Haloarchaeobius litoreus]